MKGVAKGTGSRLNGYSAVVDHGVIVGWWTVAFEGRIQWQKGSLFNLVFLFKLKG